MNIRNPEIKIERKPYSGISFMPENCLVISSIVENTCFEKRNKL